MGRFNVLLINAGGVVDCEDELTAVERGARERCVGARAMAGGNIRATAVPGRAGLGKLWAVPRRRWEVERGRSKRGREGVCVWRPRNALCAKEDEATGSFLSLVYVQTSLARREQATRIAAVANPSFISSSPTTPVAASPRLSRTAAPWRHMRCRTYTMPYAPVSVHDRPEEAWSQT